MILDLIPYSIENKTFICFQSFHNSVRYIDAYMPNYPFKNVMGAPQGFWGSWENGYLFSGSWGALVIISGDLGSKLIILGI